MKKRVKSKEEITKKFEGVLMYSDEPLKKRLIDKYITSIELANNFISECEALLKRELTKKEIDSAIKNPTEFSEIVKKLIQDSFQFPNASLDFNLNSMGLSFQSLNDALNIFNTDQRIEKYLISKGKITPEPKHIKTLEYQSEIKTKNQKQTDLFNVAKSIQESAKILRQLGITYSTTDFNYNRATNQLVTNNTNGLSINYHKILSYK